METPRAVLKGTALVVDVVLSQTGYGGQTVPLSVEDDGRIVSTQEVTLPPDGESATVKVRFTANEAGARTFKFKVPTQAGEQVTQNNARDALIQVNDRAEKILYYEGEPRPEYKFLRQGVEGDKNLQVVSLDRTAENKYYRQSVTTPDELIGGFPKTREELFQYRGLILGSVEAASFTPEQLRMIADFVNKRGGGLLMLGGRRSFAEGGWGGTPVGEVLPVVIGAANPKYLALDIAVHPTRAGGTFAVTQIADTESASATKWDAMPVLSAVNQIREAKPGATVLLNGVDKTRQDHIVLAYQRYGRGKAIAMPVQDVWAWRMDAKVAVTDTTHAMFWRRIIRWLVDGVPEQVNVSTTADRVEPGEAIKLSAEVLDSAYVEVNDSRVTAHVTAPSGKTSDVPVDWTVTRDGDYRANFVPDEEGIYDITVTAARGSAGTTGVAAKDPGKAEMHVRVSAGDAEYFDAAMRAPLLKRIAEETGGRFFTPGERGVAARSDQLQRPRRHRRGRAGSLGHAGPLPPAHRPDGRRMGLPPHAGARMMGSSASTAGRRSWMCVSTASYRCSPVSRHSGRRAGRRAADAHPRRRRRAGRRGARAEVSEVGDDLHRRGEEEGRGARRQHHAAGRPAGHAGERRESRRRPRGAREAERRRGHAAHRPRQLRRHAGGVQPAGSRSHLDGLGPTARHAQSRARRRSSTRAVRAARSCPRWRLRGASSSPRPRPAASATRRSSPSISSGVHGRGGGPRPQRPRLGRRSVRVRQDQGRAGVPAEGPAPHRARHDGRRRRRTTGGDGVPRNGPGRDGAAGGHERPGAPRAGGRA